MLQNERLLKRIRSLRHVMSNMGEVVEIVGLESRISLIENYDQRILDEWNELQHEITRIASNPNIELSERYTVEASRDDLRKH